MIQRRVLHRSLTVLMAAALATAALAHQAPGVRATGGGRPFTISLVASSCRPILINTFCDLTATTNYDVGSTPDVIEMYDVTPGSRKLVGWCATGTTCSAGVSFPSNTRHEYLAYVAALSSVPPSTYQAVSNPVYL